MSNFIDKLEITNVKIDEHSTDEVRLFIDFTLNSQWNFFMEIKKNSDKDTEIYHYFNEDATCPFCKKDINNNKLFFPTECEMLSLHTKEIEKFLLNHPNVRLRRLFL